MFYIVSKILVYFLSPLIWSVIFFIAYLLWKKRAFINIAFFFLIFFSNPFFFRVAISTWEPKIKPLPIINDSTQTVVVLGGYSAHNATTDRLRFFQSSDRLMQALLLIQKNNLKNLILTGGSPNLLIKEKPESAVISRYLKDIKMTHFNIFIDSISRNTRENALEACNIIKENNLNSNIILVTSAWHMPRAKACFIKVGLNVIPLNADPMKSIEPININDIIVPSSGTFSSWETLIKEWVGLIIYKLKGYI
ncbi:MAG: YdcF family protein [Marinilabiliaceae bacterium]|nr:YdcF family protein [Marinilabiliaceae bacterium]